MNLASHINEQAKAVNLNPSEPQKEYGNYKKGHVKVHGLDVSIENPRGSWRSGVADGKPWKSRLPNHYGYIRKTEGGDGQHVDVYLGPHLKSPHVFVIDQHELKSKVWDEHKAFIGFGSKAQAREAYHRAFSDGRGKDRIGHIETMTIQQFKGWLRDGNTKAPIKRAEGGSVKGMLAPGNIDLHNRPIVRNPDGSISTVRSIGVNTDGRETLVPTVYGQSVLSNPDATRLYQMSGKHLGQFDTPENSDAYARTLHEDQAREYVGPAGYAGGGAPAFEETSEVPPFDQTQPVADAGKLDALARGAAQGATFNFADEIAGARASAPDWVPEFVGPLPAKTMAGAAQRMFGSDQEAIGRGDKVRDEFREADEAAKKAHPYLHATGELAGAVPSMAILPGAGAAARLAPTAGRMARFGAGAADAAVTGGTYGGLTGAGEGKDIGERAMEGAKGIVSGVIGGGIVSGVGAIGRAAYERYGKPVVGGLRGLLNPDGESSRRLAAAIAVDQKLIAQGKAQGMPWNDWVAARQRGEPVTVADLGSTRTQALLRSAANTSPEGRAQLEQVIEGRFLQQGERVGDTVRGLVPGGANARKSGDQLVAEYDAGRVPAYKIAYDDGDKEIMTPVMERLMGSPMVVGAMQRAIQSGQDRAVTQGLGAFRPGVIVENGMIKFQPKPNGVLAYPNLQYWDQVKRELDQVASKAGRSGAKEEADVSGNLARLLRTELDREVPSYSAARGIAEQYFGESNALEAGRKLAGKRADPNEVALAMRKMKPDERALFQEGYASDLAERVIGNIRDTRDLTKAIFATPNERKLLSTVFGPGGVQQVQNRMALEVVMDASRKAMGNSTTARQLIEAGLAGGAIEGYLTGDWHSAAIHGAIGGIGGGLVGKVAGDQLAKGANKLIGAIDGKTARLVAEKLASPNTDVFQKGVAMAMNNEAIGRAFRSFANRIAMSGQAQTRLPVSNAIRSLQGPVSSRAEDQQQAP